MSRQGGSSIDDGRAAGEGAGPPQTLRGQWDAARSTVRTQLADSPATRATRRVLAWFPVRVWRHFLQHNGFLLAAGVSYQALFALSAAIYVVFAVVGLWLGGSEEAVEGLVDLINGYLPGLISPGGLISPTEVETIARSTTGVFSVTGAVALVVAVWTAIGWVTFSRRAVRDIFGLTPDLRSYLLLKARDLLAALVFGVLLVLGGLLTSIGTWALSPLTSLIGLTPGSGVAGSGIRIASVAVSFLLNSAVLVGLFRFLAGTTLKLRSAIPGSLVGGAGLTVLQVGAGLLLSYTPSNPLLATFAIFIGLLLWFRLVGVVMLVAASWVTVAATDAGRPILPVSPEAQRAEEHAALLLAARVRLRDARQASATAPWWRRRAARRTVRAAERELDEIGRSAPPQRPGSLLE